MSSTTDEPQFVDIEVDAVHTFASSTPFPDSPVQSPIRTDTPFQASSSSTETEREGFDGVTSVVVGGVTFPSQPAPAETELEGVTSAVGRVNPMQTEVDEVVGGETSIPPLHHPSPSNALPATSGQQSQITKWPRILGGVMIIILIIGAALITFMTTTDKGKKQAPLPNPECLLNLVVSKDGTGNFTTISEAVEASPSNSPYRFCIYIRAGEYNETVNIGNEKYNLSLMGEGTGKTIITSHVDVDVTWPQATLRISGEDFLARDLTIVSTTEYGFAVENLGDNTVFFMCRFEGANTTLRMKGTNQFYRNCSFYGKSSLVFGFANAFFQKCEFFSQKSYYLEKTVFFSESAPMSIYDSVFVIHACAFHVTIAGRFLNDSETTTYLGGSFGDFGSLVVMQSSLDASIGGYYDLRGSPPNSTFYAIFGNTRRGAPITSVPPFIHPLSDIDAASKFSLREFVGGRNWIPDGIEYDLDLT